MKCKLLKNDDDYLPLMGLLETLDRLGVVDYHGVVTIDHQSGEAALMFKDFMVEIVDEE